MALMKIKMENSKETSFWGLFLKKSRKLALVLGALVVILLLTGCNPSAQSQQQAIQISQVVATPKVEVKTETKEEPVSFETKEEQTNSLSKGKTQIKQEGKDGKKAITFEVTYTDGKEASRKQVKEEVAEQPQTKIILVGTYVATPTPKPSCDPNYSGACVPIASDVDCAGGSGNGPAYVRGPVYVIGIDIYDLDRDGNGIGCEK